MEQPNVNPIPTPENNSEVGITTLTKSLFVKLSCYRVTKRDGTTGYVLSSRDQGKKCIYIKDDFTLNFSMKKKEAWNPNQAKNESGFEFEAWLFNEYQSAQAKEKAYLDMSSIFPSKAGDTETIFLYMNSKDENQLLNEEEYLALA